MMRYFSTFSGIGGFEIGIHNAYREAERRKQSHTQSNEEAGQGLVTPQGQSVSSSDRRASTSLADKLDERPLCVGYSEIDKYATRVYDYHYKGVKNYGDITQINAEELPDFDCLVGGFPCQAFSMAGLRRGFEDTRGTLFFDLARILRAKQPRLFVFENVKGLLSHDAGNTFRTIIATVTELGYDCQWCVLNSKDFGVPQNRERVIIVGHLRGTSRPQVFPLAHAEEMGAAAKATEQEVHELAITETARQYASWTGNYVDDIEVRKLTPLECERLQGFPDNWTEYGCDVFDYDKLAKERYGRTLYSSIPIPMSDAQRYKMCGNAVTTNVIQAVFERIFAE